MGKYAFSLSEVKVRFPQKSPPQIKNALNRLITSGRIASVWRGFYAIVLPEYGMRGAIPPTEYIDQLMNHLGKDYYVALLSAAAIHGASHQKQQGFTFICNHILHPKEKKEVILAPVLKKRIPHKYVERKNVRSGTINVSSPILTAIDLVLYPIKSGGLGNIATVLSELTESIELNNLDIDLFKFFPTSAIQRLGYLLDDVIGEKALADMLQAKAEVAQVKFRRILLAPYLDTDVATTYYNARWKVMVNEDAETDI
jgi:predicted transcriptional regulator of viral defense system